MKYLLDTNVISEVTKPSPDYSVICWLQDFATEVGTCAICIQELYYGLQLMPAGKRRDQLWAHTDAMVKDLAERTLAFDSFSGYICAELHAKDRVLGRSTAIEDLMIAATAQANNCIVATRNTKDFEPLGVTTVNPFAYR